MVMAKEVAFAGAFSQAKGILFSMPLSFFSHLKASNKTPFTTAVLVSLKPEADTVGVGVVVIVPVLVAIDRYLNVLDYNLFNNLNYTYLKSF